MSDITLINLSCGMPLLVERIPGVRSVGLTWLVGGGTARDPHEKLGLSAMWAELLLRGAGDLNSREQADAFDRLGASRDTAVGTFQQSISATMLGQRLADVLPLLVDMVRRPRMAADSVEPSRDLCLQAIESLADDPQERVMLLLREKHAPPPINRSSLGTVEGLSAIMAEELLPEWRRRAVPDGAVLGLAGDVDAGQAAEQLDTLLDGWSGRQTEVTWGEATTRGAHHETDKTNQVHIALVHDAPAERDEDAWLERMVAAVLSGGMSSRLFTEVREKRSLCYSVYARYSADRDYGRTVAYVGTTPERAQESLDVLYGELQRIMTPDGRITPEEFQRSVVSIKSRLVMSGESTGARAGAIARDYRKLGHARTLDELAARVDSLTLEEVNAYLARRSLGEITIQTIGPEPLKTAHLLGR